MFSAPDFFSREIPRGKKQVLRRCVSCHDKATVHQSQIEQVCQIFLDAKYQNGEKYTKLAQNISNGRKIGQMSIKYTNTLHCKTLLNLPKFRFLV
jgi:hypothetical protein